MTLQALKCFAAVAKTSSYASAARQLYISQPAVTHQIQQLERELGVRLLDRTKRLVRLTPAGAVFYSDVAHILEQLEVAVSHARGGEQFTELLFISCESMVQLWHLPEIYREFHLCCPNVCIHNEEVSGAEWKAHLAQGRMDIAFLSKPGSEGMAGIEYATLFQGHFCCVLPEGHALAERERILPEDLSGETLIFLDTMHCPPEKERVQEELRARCRDIRLNLSSSSLATAAMIRGGLGIAIMSNFVCPKEPGIVTVPYATQEQVEYGIAWHTGDESRKVKQFVRIARRLYQKDT